MALAKAHMAAHRFDALGLNRREAQEIIETFFEEIRAALARGEEVKLSGSGISRSASKRNAPGRNPKTGEAIPMTARRVMTFMAGQKIKARVEADAGVAPPSADAPGCDERPTSARVRPVPAGAPGGGCQTPGQRDRTRTRSRWPAVRGWTRERVRRVARVPFHFMYYCASSFLRLSVAIAAHDTKFLEVAAAPADTYSTDLRYSNPAGPQDRKAIRHEHCNPEQSALE